MSLVQFRPEAPFADLAHLVERDLAKVEVAGSSPVIRSKKSKSKDLLFSIQSEGSVWHHAVAYIFLRLDDLQHFVLMRKMHRQSAVVLIGEIK